MLVVKNADHMRFLERPADCAELLLRFFSGKPLTDVDYLSGSS